MSPCARIGRTTVLRTKYVGAGGQLEFWEHLLAPCRAPLGLFVNKKERDYSMLYARWVFIMGASALVAFPWDPGRQPFPSVFVGSTLLYAFVCRLLVASFGSTTEAQPSPTQRAAATSWATNACHR